MRTKQQGSEGRFFFASRLITMGVILLGCSQNSFGQWATNGNNINNTNSGNVGVGTASPNTKLAVGITNTTGVESPIVTSQIDFTTQGGMYQYRDDAWNGHSSLRFKTYYGSPVASMQTPLTLKYDGNVGIGTTSPTSKLHILGGNVFHQFSATAGQEYGFYTSINNNHFTSNLYFDGFWKMLSTGKGAVISTAPLGGSGSAFSVWADNTTRAAGSPSTLSNLFNITMAGDVGIGTAFPDARLTVVGAGITLPTTYNNGDVATFVAPTDGFTNIALVKGGITNPQGLHFGVNQASLYSEIQAARNGVTTNTLVLNRQGGNVGIGTTTPAFKLDVAGQVRSSSGGFVFPDGTVQTTAGAGGPWSTSGTNAHNTNTGNVGIGTTMPTTKLHVQGDGKFTGNVTVDGNIAARYQDVAEWVESSQELIAGTVVVLDSSKSNQVIASTSAYDTRVAGVISQQPGIVLGEKGDSKVLVATTGRVRVNVDATNGPIQIGDLLVTSNREGFAMKSVPVKLGSSRIHRPGTLIGKALEPLASGTGEILVLLSLQ